MIYLAKIKYFQIMTNIGDIDMKTRQLPYDDNKT